MSRQVRRVPENWQHPKQVNKYNPDEEQYVPLLDDYVNYLKYYKEYVDEFIQHMTEVIETGSTTIYDNVFTDRKKVYRYLTADGGLRPPKITDFMPSGEWYQLYEEVSEGTPITPPFASKEELKSYLMTDGTFWDNTPWPDNRADGMICQGYAMSGVMTDGKIYRAEEAFDIKELK